VQDPRSQQLLDGQNVTTRGRLVGLKNQPAGNGLGVATIVNIAHRVLRHLGAHTLCRTGAQDMPPTWRGRDLLTVCR
jgi:hypothetical protein